jgi:hypothetical protein
MGHQSDLYAMTIDDDLRDDVIPWTDTGARRGDLTIFHFALVSPMTAEFARLPAGRVLQYHNVTPALLRRLRRGIFCWRRQPRRPKTWPGTLTCARRLRVQPAGARGPGVHQHRRLPHRHRHRSDHQGAHGPYARDHADRGQPPQLPVRRPHRAEQEDRGPLRPAEVCAHVDAATGSFVGRPTPAALLLLSGRSLPSTDAGAFLHRTAGRGLATYYRTANAYISLSEHEGFCVPLLEAMAADVPVLAYASTAVPDTLGGAGIQFAPKDLEYAAELLGELAYNDTLRTQVIAGQRRRLADFGDARIRQELERLTS